MKKVLLKICSPLAAGTSGDTVKLYGLITTMFFETSKTRLFSEEGNQIVARYGIC